MKEQLLERVLKKGNANKRF